MKKFLLLFLMSALAYCLSAQDVIYTLTGKINNNATSIDTSSVLEKTKTDYTSANNGATDAFTDPRDGKTYKTVKIGTQTWMAENLAYLPSVDSSSNVSENDPRYYVYDYHGNSVSDAKATDNYTTYGVLYNWPAAKASCPGGWHLPSDEEWKTLEMYLGMSQSQADDWSWRGTDEGKKMKSTSGWYNNGNGTNSSGFNALPGGTRYGSGSFNYLYIGNWWSSSEGSGTNAWTRGMAYNNDRVTRYDGGKAYGFSVRCIRDNTTSVPTAGFSANPTTGTAPLTVSFTVHSTGNPSSWLWNFGDDSTSTEQNPSHTYQMAGTYTVKLTATNDQGSDTSTKTDYITVNSGSGITTGTFTDPRDGKTYKTVKIGTQTWMAENLAYLPGVSPPSDGSGTDSYYYVYGYYGTSVSEAKATDNYSTYGVLYNWPAAKAACPSGWHLPSDEEWKTLEMYLGMNQSQADDYGWRGTVEGKEMKSTSGWSNNGNGTNFSGFNALPGGSRGISVSLYGLDNIGNWWSSSEYSSAGGAWYRGLNSDGSQVYRNGVYKAGGFSVRCVRDNTTSVPTASFSANPTAGTTPLTVSFTDNSTDSPSSWSWDFGDGAKDTVKNPVHIYQKAGSYTVSLIVGNQHGSDTLIRSDYIQVQDGIQMHFTPVWSGKPYQPMNILIDTIVVPDSDLHPNDEIGLFDTDKAGNEICVGAGIVSGTISSKQPLTVVASADDPATPKTDGFTAHNKIIYKVWSSGAQKEYTQYGAKYNPKFDSLYSPSDTAVVKLRFKFTLGTFEFISKAKPFVSPTFFTNAKSYFYYYINANDKTPPKGTTFSFNLKEENNTIPAGAAYLGNGILKFWLKIDKNSNLSNIQISIPNTISNNGNEIMFKNIPSHFTIPVQNDPVNQNIDIFAGGSAGVKLIGGGAGAGPSVAAASISLNGTGGMGINFYRDTKGDEFITRRFEAGVGVSVQSPSINAVVGDIQTGIEAGVMVKGIIGQTMFFPKSLDTKLAKEAKAAYILETFTMGGVELSPFASIFLRALEKSLIVANPDLNAIYSDLYYSNQVGSSVEGDASVGFSVSLDKKNPQSKLDIVDYGGYIALTNKTYHNIQNNNKSFYFKYACGFDLSALKIKIANVGLGNLVENKYGNIFSIVANYVPQKGISSFDLSYQATSSAKIMLSSFSTSYKYNFIIPKNIIQNALNSNDLIESVAGRLNPNLPKKPFKVGIKYFNKNLDELCAANPDTLNTLKDHIIFQKTKSSAKGLNVNVSVGLDAALGIGGGLSLGINFSYLDKMNYPKSQYIVANSQVLPIAEYNDIPDNQRLFSIQKEIQDVFQGTVLLIKNPLNNLVHVVNQTVDKGKKFVVNMQQGTAKLTGKLMGNGLKWIARVSDPATKTIQKSTFLEPRIINAYSSHRIIHLNNKSASLAAEKAGSVLYIVSNNVNVSLLDSSNKVVDSFDPVTLSIAIDNKKVQELGFGQNEKRLAKMYQYDANKLVWVELSGDSNKDIDTVSTQITNSASYAIGIEINASDDTTAPNIVDYYPKNGEEISPVTNFWAKLYESPTGVGIDLSKTFLIIDSVKVDAVWDPVENIISFKSSDSLSPGQHIFEIVVKDYNGNTDSISSTVIVGNTTSINTHENIVSFNCYPVPMNNILNIEINSVSSKPISVSIYNQLGQLVSSIFECQPQDGHIKVQWDRTGKNYQHVRPGIYFVRVKQNNNIVVKKIILK